MVNRGQDRNRYVKQISSANSPLPSRISLIKSPVETVTSNDSELCHPSSTSPPAMPNFSIPTAFMVLPSRPQPIWRIRCIHLSFGPVWRRTVTESHKTRHKQQLAVIGAIEDAAVLSADCCSVNIAKLINNTNAKKTMIPAQDSVWPSSRRTGIPASLMIRFVSAIVN